MDKTEYKGDWTELKGKIKHQFALLTDNDLKFMEDKKEEMMGRLQAKLGKTKDELNKIIKNL